MGFNSNTRVRQMLCCLLAIWLLLGGLIPLADLGMHQYGVEAAVNSTVVNNDGNEISSTSPTEPVTETEESDLTIQQEDSSGQDLNRDVSGSRALDTSESSHSSEANSIFLNEDEEITNTNSITGEVLTEDLSVNSNEAFYGQHNINIKSDGLTDNEVILRMLSTAGTQNTGSISGVVTNPEGALLPGIGVRLYTSDWERIAYEQTDSNGQYNFGSLGAGSYMIRFEPY
ncbi:MAG: carboxypeptidase-like regulatory domain-containing protein, partial [Desulfotomaculaceae bacterium]